jgi:putative Mg2+ transporter-C (MgtC) family protein
MLNLPTSYLEKIPIIMEGSFSLKIFIALLLGSMIGWEREKFGKMAGIRTFGLICAGSCAFSLFSLSLQEADTSRIVSYIALGIGFIGGAIIYLSKDGKSSIQGLTTASSLWTTASIGILVAFNLYLIAFVATIITLITLHLPSFRLWIYFSKKQK